MLTYATIPKELRNYLPKISLQCSHEKSAEVIFRRSKLPFFKSVYGYAAQLFCKITPFPIPNLQWKLCFVNNWRFTKNTHFSSQAVFLPQMQSKSRLKQFSPKSYAVIPQTVIKKCHNHTPHEQHQEVHEKGKRKLDGRTM